MSIARRLLRFSALYTFADDLPFAVVGVGVVSTNGVSIPYRTASVFVPYLDRPFIEAPAGPGWRVLLRPNQPFAVFYTETGAADAIKDLNPTTGRNYDDDGDGVPDYAERVYNCLVAAHTRYQAYYGLSQAREDANFHWLRLDYPDPISGAARASGVYPLVIRDQTGVAPANTWSIGELLQAGLLSAPSVPWGATWITLEPEAASKRDDANPPWRYPWTETTLYHEMFHVYQGIYKAKTDLGGFTDQWLYEGTAVYAADQALLPPCSTDLPDASGHSLNPPRIPRSKSPTGLAGAVATWAVRLRCSPSHLPLQMWYTTRLVIFTILGTNLDGLPCG